MAFFDDPLFLQMLDSLSDGIVLLRNSVTVFANQAARNTLQRNPCGLPLAKLLADADLELPSRPTTAKSIFSMLLNHRWFCLELRDLTAEVSMLTIREDVDVNVCALSMQPDQDDLDWLRIIASSMLILSNRYRAALPPAVAEKMQNYAHMLHKYVNNSTLRTLNHPDDDLPDGAVPFTFGMLLDHAAAQLGDSLTSAGLLLSFQRSHERHGAILYGHLNHFMMMLYNALDVLLYHSRCVPGKPMPVDLSEGATRTHLFVCFSIPSAALPFPVSAEALAELLHKAPETFSTAYTASVKLVWAVVRLYHGLMVSDSTAESHTLKLCFPKALPRLSSPCSMSDCTVSPAVEFSDALTLPDFPKHV